MTTRSDGERARKPGEIDRWVSLTLVGVAPEETELALMRADSVMFDRFRRSVLITVLKKEFEQDAREVAGLVDQLLGGFPTPAAQDADEHAFDEDGLRVETHTIGFAPVEDLVHKTWDQIERRGHWIALGTERPDFATAWMTKRITWRVKDELRPRGPSSAKDDAPKREHHRVAGWLSEIAEADPTLGGDASHARAHGAYAKVLGQISEYLASHDPLDAHRYVLRKLFPWHAWPPLAEDARHAVGGPLQRGLENIWSARTDWDVTCIALVSMLDEVAFTCVQEGLETSARFHVGRDDFPNWNETLAWTAGKSAIGDTKRANTLQRRIGRIDADVERFIHTRRDSVMRHYEELP